MSWIAVGLIGLIAVITLLRVLLWIHRNVCRGGGSGDINPPLVKDEQSVPSYGSYDDDDNNKSSSPQLPSYNNY